MNKVYCESCNDMYDFYSTHEKVTETLHGLKVTYYKTTPHCAHCGAEVWNRDIRDMNLNRLNQAYEIAKEGNRTWQKGHVFRYRIITNLHCNQNCAFCYQPYKEPLVLSLDKLRETMQKVGKLERATIMGGESLLLPNLSEYFAEVHKYVKTICLVTNGTLINEEIVKELVLNGLEEMAISVSSIEQYEARREQILIAHKYVPNLRINIPKSPNSIGEKLHTLIKCILDDDLFLVVCEDLMGRYGDYELESKMGAKLLSNDHNFLMYEYEGKQFGMFAYHGDPNAKPQDEESGYEKTDVIITPLGNFSVWERYCQAVGNKNISTVKPDHK